MTYTAPIDPPADGNAITRAFYITYVKDNIGHLRTITGGDPGAAGLVLQSSGAASAAWTSTPSLGSLTLSGVLIVTGNIATGGSFTGGAISGTSLNASGALTIGSISSTGTVVATIFSATNASGFVFSSAEGGGTDSLYESGSHTPAIAVSGVQVQRWQAASTTITGATNITGQVTITGSGTYTGTWAAASDQRLKSQIAPVQNALAQVMLLKPITYRQSALYRRLYGNREDTNRRYQGFIAQDVAQVFPDVVVENQDDNGMLAVDYGRLVVSLTAAVQELAARVVALEGAP